MLQEKINRYNSMILEKLSVFLNFDADLINEEVIQELTTSCDLKKEEAFSILLAEILGFDIENNPEHMEVYEKYFPSMITLLNRDEYTTNPYYKNIKIPDIKFGRWKLKNEKYKSYEAFVFNDLKRENDGRIIPQIGFFDSEFSYPAVLEDNREWMVINPNEIETMSVAVLKAFGKVLTFGLGLGYFAYMVSEKISVTSVTVVEKDENVIELFKKYILPQFKNRSKVTIIHDDAFSYAEKSLKDENYDFVFTDLWHDPSDGIDMYLKMKRLEILNSKSRYMYWIEKTMQCYLK